MHLPKRKMERNKTAKKRTRTAATMRIMMVVVELPSSGFENDDLMRSLYCEHSRQDVTAADRP